MHFGSAFSCALLVSFACATPAHAQTETAVVVPPATVEVAPAAPMLRIPATTPVDFEFVSQLSSKTSKIDEMFPIRLIKPILLDGAVVVPAGTMGQGQIVHAAKSGWGGKAGELLVAARFIDFNGVRIPLRRFRMGGSGAGEDRTGTALVVGMVVSGPLVFAISGGEKIIPPGTLANAIVSADTDIPAASAPSGAPAANATIH